MKKLILALIVFVAFILSALAGSVQVAWTQSTSPDVIGNNIYYGVFSGTYTNKVSTSGYATTNATVDGLIPEITYYLAATAVNSVGQESPFSNEIQVTIPPTNVTYIGEMLDYGTNLTSLSSQLIFVTSFTNQPGNFYSQSLIITNNPLVGTRPQDGNNYTYLGLILNYGTNIVSINHQVFPVTSFTNPPQLQFYRGSLVITNRPF